MSKLEIKLELDDGRVLFGEVGRITRTELGLESDGRCFWATVECSFGGGSVQGFSPVLAASEYEAEDATVVYRHIRAILDAVGVRTWEQLKGEDVMVLREETSSHALIKGLASLSGKNVYLVRDMVNEEKGVSTTR